MTIKRSAAGVRLAPWQSLLLGVTLLALAWHLRFAAMLIFGAVLVAATLDALAAPVQGTDRLRRSTSLIVVMVIVAFAGGVVWWFGTPVVDQLASLSADIPHAWTALRSWLENSLAGAWLLTTLRGSAMAKLPLAGLADVAGVTVQAISAGILVVLMGLYLAFDIELYERGLIRLFPLRLRERVEGALNEAGTSLRRWLVGQAVAMLAVGTSVTIGLLLLDVPLALALGLVAAVLEFIPFFGPIASGALAVLVAFAQGPHLALYVAVLFIVIQQLESNVLVPIVQRWAVRLPPRSQCCRRDRLRLALRDRWSHLRNAVDGRRHGPGTPALGDAAGGGISMKTMLIFAVILPSARSFRRSHHARRRKSSVSAPRPCCPRLHRR